MEPTTTAITAAAATETNQKIAINYQLPVEK
jgi:hypothetical protein